MLVNMRRKVSLYQHEKQRELYIIVQELFCNLNYSREGTLYGRKNYHRTQTWCFLCWV
jgi:hypothetical protein